mmetsp:Transcript_8789/g.16742  ORF Transcript_8789/g.16742 Transcript_8789/m.16742 type:complete len:363 (-) Transcript_8789:53-1141(-)|eukprot:CAMPEP_0172713504 /NCGR_PEP_ID=MMETSP1074-20121228/62701_1 /TAXON_ID=2916 /ORGANISM="Ceratium fusus, Strain PA161109" /LENGTH=362 /DNA_ID=CAMNT_0013537619 /DNA_START=34 /DNA_END=1122 /DNA_ORIENTATION=+
MALLMASRRRGCRETRDGYWAPKWRRLLSIEGNNAAVACGTAGTDREPPRDYSEFDRTVRGMLNRISTENAPRLLPLDPGLRVTCEDCPPWLASRFAELMLTSYLRVIHTSRGARGLATRSADNVLPEYLEAVSPLLAQSPRLVEALLAWLGRLLHGHVLCWPTARLLLLASREKRDRATLPGHSLGRLPPELLQGRILDYVAPPTLPASTDGGCNLTAGWGMADGQKDVVAVLAHLIMFAPATSWPHISAFAFSLAENALVDRGELGEGKVYLAASILAHVAQRLDRTSGRTASVGKEAILTDPVQDLGPLSRLTSRLCDVARGARLSGFVGSRTKAAIDHVQRLQEKLHHFMAQHPQLLQ